jgi:hypothetical protein
MLERVSDQVITSAQQAREEHVAFGDRSEGPGTILYPTQIPSVSNITALSAVSHSAEDVRDAKSRGSGCGSDPGISIISTLVSQVPAIISEAPSMNRGNGDAQSREVGGGAIPDITTPTVANENPTVTNFQGASNFQISNSNITAIGGNATIIRFGGEYSLSLITSQQAHTRLDGQFTEVQRNLVRRMCGYRSKHNPIFVDL